MIDPRRLSTVACKCGYNHSLSIDEAPTGAWIKHFESNHKKWAQCVRGLTPPDPFKGIEL